MRSASINDATGATVQPPAPAKRQGLSVRIVSALVLAPPALAALYLGPPYSDVLVLVAAALAAWEWARLCANPPSDRPGAAGGVLIAAVVGASLAGALGFFSIGGWLLATGAIAGALAASRTQRGDPLWHAIGVVYLGTAMLAFLWLRQDPLTGRGIILWLVAVVWATDIGAYATGRAIGGPLLAPRISPGKTWAGLGGGAVMAAAAGVGVVAILGGSGYVGVALAGAGLAVVAQVGDLFESHLKRRAGVKDASALIPGHGGVLDRIDGLLAAALVLGGIVRLTGSWG